MGVMPSSWMYVVGPVAIYLLERIIRFIRSLYKQTINEYVIHPSDVLELRIDNKNKRVNYRSGQYVFLNVTEISYLEWHPFTITSSPDDDNLTSNFM
jgi:predicted ferric reductase